MNLKEIKNYYNNKPVEYVFNEYTRLNEDSEFIPRFSLKDTTDIRNIPINEPLKYSKEKMIKAIKYGMIFLINYKGEEDDHFSGHERVIYPMVLGRSKKGKPLLRGWHLNGWSVSSNKKVNKTWRMFRTDRILSMTFTGSFYRLPPSGYKSDDKGMRGGIIAKADFNRIRKNQQSLIKQKEIQDKDEVTINNKEKRFSSVIVENTDSEVDLKRPFDNSYINNIKNLAGSRITFCKSVYGSTYIAILGAYGQPGSTIKILEKGGKNIGVFKVLDSATGDVLKKIKSIKGNADYDLYLFDSKS